MEEVKALGEDICNCLLSRSDGRGRKATAHTITICLSYASQPQPATRLLSGLTSGILHRSPEGDIAAENCFAAASHRARVAVRLRFGVPQRHGLPNLPGLVECLCGLLLGLLGIGGLELWDL
jgi:hypothetical protein